MWEEIVIGILGFLVIIGSARYYQIKKVIKIVSEALEDDFLTIEELRAIIVACVKG